MKGASPPSSSTTSTEGRLGLVARQLLDVLERVSIQPIRAEHSLSEPPQALSALCIAQRRDLGGRGGAQNRMFHDPRVAPEHDQNLIVRTSERSAKAAAPAAAPAPLTSVMRAPTLACGARRVRRDARSTRRPACR